ncbi:MAG: hypothetical protein ONB44_05005 [candidate division KSB1 bacterium]|nr:hypothetical protein [candidate division KSB1 bacterium]MDZ7301482.1 hypothetical protein [candidate division KSB1 bacterium]MDZ7310884.1 hypothetical protein [candidate division KSB1 bacterium]
MLQHLDTVLAFAAVMLGVSMLVTVLTQMINAVLGLRGRSLLWGLETLLKHADPDLEKHARKIADRILRHPLLSHTQQRRATAIRREEFISLFEEVLTQKDFAASLKMITEKGYDQASAEAQKVKFKAPQQYVHEIEVWFDSVMERVSERFALRSKWVSVSLAIVVAFAIHLDGIALLEKLSTDNALRTSLVQSTNLLLNRAQEVFALSSNAYTEAIFKMPFNQQEVQLLANPPSFSSAEAAANWIRLRLGDTNRTRALVSAYDDTLQVILKKQTGRLAAMADSIRTDFNKTRLVLIPNPYPKWPYGWREIAGMIMSCLLISLGAPFWYNVLKNLSSLRPRVADILQREARAQREARERKIAENK